MGVLALAAGCSDARPTQVPSTGSGVRLSDASVNLRRLSGDEIRRLIVGRTLSHNVELGIARRQPVITTPYSETYQADGIVRVRLHRAGTSGRYWITDDRLCMELALGTRECRYFAREPGGELLQQDVTSTGWTPIIIGE